MGQEELIVEFAKEELMPLVDHHGFQPPTVTADRGATQIDFLSEEIAVEIEFDWRDFDVFVLIVRLEGGRLPGGYYVSEGKECRKHLREILCERGWAVSSAHESSAENPSEGRLRARIVAQKEDLLSHIDDMLSLGEALF